MNLSSQVDIFSKTKSPGNQIATYCETWFKFLNEISCYTECISSGLVRFLVMIMHSLACNWKCRKLSEYYINSLDIDEPKLPASVQNGVSIYKFDIESIFILNLNCFHEYTLNVDWVLAYQYWSFTYPMARWNSLLWD